LSFVSEKRNPSVISLTLLTGLVLVAISHAFLKVSLSFFEARIGCLLAILSAYLAAIISSHVWFSASGILTSSGDVKSIF
jgi:hypothetical protein